MIQLKNIHKAADRIFCDAFVEDCKTPVSLELDPKTEEFREVRLPDGYEWCKAHIRQAKWYLLSAKNDLPHERLIIWC